MPETGTFPISGFGIVFYILSAYSIQSFKIS